MSNLNENNLSKKVLGEIHEKHICPKPKWQFVMKNIIFWGAFVISIGVGAVAFSGFLYRVTASDWNIYRQLGRGPVPHFFMTLPYIWILVIALFALLAIYNFKHTKSGYRIRPVIIITTSIIIGIAGGTIMFVSGYGKQIDYHLLQKPPFGRELQERRLEMWLQPDKGLLVGKVSGILEPEVIIIEDYTGQEWQILYSQPFKHVIQVGDEIRVIGEILANNEFTADKVMLWEGKQNRKEVLEDLK